VAETAALCGQAELEMLRSAEAAQRNRADELQARVDEFEAKREELAEAYAAMAHEVARLRALELEREELKEKLQMMSLQAEATRDVGRRLKAATVMVGSCVYTVSI